MSRLTAEALRYHSYGPIDFVLDGGTCASLTGPSGAGKTLLLRALADLDPHTGRVLLDDTAAEAIPAPAWRRQVAMLPAESAWWYDTVGAHFATRPTAPLAELGFEPDVMSWQIARLSTGERQRLAILRLLGNRPRALLLDEPTANLDTDNTTAVETLLARYRADENAAVLWVTHDPEQRQRVATAHYRIEHGRWQAETPA